MSDTNTIVVNIFICPKCSEVYESLAPAVWCEDCEEEAEQTGWFERKRYGNQHD